MLRATQYIEVISLITHLDFTWLTGRTRMPGNTSVSSVMSLDQPTPRNLILMFMVSFIVCSDFQIQ